MFTLASAVSLVLCVATCVLWVRSYQFDQSAGVARTDDELTPGRAMLDLQARIARMRGTSAADARQEVRALYVRGRRGEISLGAYHGPAGIIGGRPGLFLSAERLTGGPDPPAAGWRRFGFARALDAIPSEAYWHTWTVPCWLAAAVTFALPALWVRTAAARRRRPGCCPACGYDLRATPERCPECGKVPSEPAGQL